MKKLLLSAMILSFVFVSCNDAEPGPDDPKPVFVKKEKAKDEIDLAKLKAY